MACHAAAPPTPRLDLLDAYVALVRATQQMPQTLLSFFVETYQAVADQTAIPVRVDHLRPGMRVIAAERLEDRTVSLVTETTADAQPCISVRWAKTGPDDFHPGGALYPADYFLVVTLDSLDAVFDPAARRTEVPA
ncbi:hypothetical protein ACFU0X_19675 [Streptomyces cellulosae]|uniref:Ig-like domain-containing protein n=1 Tax=Streptomyces cellulosae TaxID=1968 RepID=A0ABW6JM87_STRCE